MPGRRIARLSFLFDLGIDRARRIAGRELVRAWVLTAQLDLVWHHAAKRLTS